MRDYVFAGGTAVVTGAASGIGAALSRGLAARGSHLVLLDRDADRLADVAGSIKAEWSTVDVETLVVDLSDAAAVREVAETLLAGHPRIRLLVNNAGVALAGRFDQISTDDFDWLMSINFRAVMLLTHALLPALKAESGSHLVNLSSIFGIIAPAGQSAYVASKFAVRGLTEVLRHELEPDGIGVTAVHPGGVRTRIAESARVGSGVSGTEYETGRQQWDRLLTMDPATAAAIIIDGIEHRRRRVLVGRDARFADLIARLLPASYGPVLAALTSRLTGRDR